MNIESLDHFQLNTDRKAAILLKIFCQLVPRCCTDEAVPPVPRARKPKSTTSFQTTVFALAIGVRMKTKMVEASNSAFHHSRSDIYRKAIVSI